MSRRTRLVALLAATELLAATTLLLRPAAPVRAAGEPITWRTHIAPLVYSNCASCHHAGGSAPFALTSYAEARRWGPQMVQVTASHSMPPWLPAQVPGSPVHFADERRLSARQVDEIATWVRAGMPEGDGPAPQPPTFTAGWAGGTLGAPDLVLEMPESVTVPASGEDLFENFVLPGGVARTRWVRAMEIEPTGAALAQGAQATHHANVILDRSGSFRAAHPADWKQGVPGMDLEIAGGTAFDPDSHFLFWKPDSTALVEPAGMPWRLDPGDDLILNMHLKPTGRPETIRARIGLWFTDKPATAHPMLLQLEHDAALDIPAGEAHFTVSDELKLPVAVELLGIYPHAHYLCRRMEAWAVLPGGRRETLLEIPDWDIDRQAVYRLAAPVRLPAGTTVAMRYTYDNSSANVHNPASPPVRVTHGNRARDEMGHLWLQVLPLGSGPGGEDPRITLDRAWMETRLKKEPGDTLALFNLGSIAMGANEAAAAEGFYRRALALRPGDVRAMDALGAALAAKGDAAGAEAQFEAALKAQPADDDAAFNLAALRMAGGDSIRAQELYRAVLARRPDDARAHVGLGEALLTEGQPAEAEKELRQAVTLDGADPAARRALAMAYAGRGAAAEALEQLRAWARLAPADPEPHRALAQVLGATGEAAAALAEQREVVRLAPASAADWNDLGAREARAGRLEEARVDFERALKLDPASEAARANLARVK